MAASTSPRTETTQLDELVVGASYMFTYAKTGYTYRLGKLLQANVLVRFPNVSPRGTWKFENEWRNADSAQGTYRMVTDAAGFSDKIGTPAECEIRDRYALVVGKRYAFLDLHTHFMVELGVLNKIDMVMYCPEGAGRGGELRRTWKFDNLWHTDGVTSAGIYIEL